MAVLGRGALHHRPDPLHRRWPHPVPVVRDHVVVGMTVDGWFPSRYGAQDSAGALNEISPAGVLAAITTVREGRVHDLAHVLHQDVPAFPGRTYRSYLTTNYHQVNRRRSDAGPDG